MGEGAAGWGGGRSRARALIGACGVAGEEWGRRRDGTGEKKGAAAGGQKQSAAPPPPSEPTEASRARREEPSDWGGASSRPPHRSPLLPDSPRGSGDHVSSPPGLAWPLADSLGLAARLRPGHSSPLRRSRVPSSSSFVTGGSDRPLLGEPLP